MAFLVAAGVAAVVAGFEQATQFGLKNLPLSHRALRWWLARIAVEVGAACAVLGLGWVTGAIQLHRWWVGAIAALVSTLGLRSTLIDAASDAYGARTLFDRWRGYVTARLRNIAAIASTSHVMDETLPAVQSAGVTPNELGQRLTTFIKASGNLSPAQVADELAWVKEIVEDVASDQEERNAALVNKALELGGDDLVDQIRQDALRRQASRGSSRDG